MSGENGSMKSQCIYQHNGFSSLINYYNSGDIEMNGDLNNGGVSCGIGLINSHIISQCN